MKHLKILLLCTCLLLSGSYSVRSQSEESEAKSNTAGNRFPNIFCPVENWFRKIFNPSSKPSSCAATNVINLYLSQSSIVLSCPMKKGICSNQEQSIEVSTIAADPDGDILFYNYKTTGGRVVGKGEKVTWDLSGVKPGYSTITAAVNDGCGFCGTTVTKVITVRECPNCN